MSILKEITKHVDEMPGLSPTVMRLLDLTRDINCSPKDLLDVIKIDPVLTGKVLKLINSAYFSLPNEVVSLNHALVLLGVNTIKNLALSTAVVNVLGKDKSGSPFFDMHRVWEHCLSCAVAARTIARETGVERKLLEEYFIAGLLHDIGKILLVLYHPDEYQKVIENADNMFCLPNEQEMETIGITHQEIGRLLAEKWKLGPGLTGAIFHHHAPVYEDANSRIIVITHIADYMVNLFNIRFYPVDADPVVDPQAWNYLKLNASDCQHLLKNLQADLQKAAVFLKANNP